MRAKRMEIKKQDWQIKCPAGHTNLQGSSSAGASVLTPDPSPCVSLRGGSAKSPSANGCSSGCEKCMPRWSNTTADGCSADDVSICLMLVPVFLLPPLAPLPPLRLDLRTPPLLPDAKSALPFFARRILTGSGSPRASQRGRHYAPRGGAWECPCGGSCAGVRRGGRGG
jgi:hypothetical protein